MQKRRNSIADALDLRLFSIPLSHLYLPVSVDITRYPDVKEPVRISMA